VAASRKVTVSRFLELLKMKRPLGPALGLGLLVAAGASLALTSNGPAVATVAAQRGDLALTVDVEGELKAARSTEIGPPVVRDVWEYKITLLAPEGSTVRKGQPVVAFDPSQLVRSLDEKRAELAEAAKRIERKGLEVEGARRDLELQLAETESRLQKARLKNDVPEDLRSRNELRQTALELRQAEQESASLRKRIAALHASEEAALRALKSQRDRAASRVTELEAGVAKMTVRAPQDGIVIYKTGWRDEKKKVGDAVWFGETFLQIPDLTELYAEGEVDEADAGAVTVGQRVRLRLEALPDEDVAGSIRRIARAVRRKSQRVPSKVMRVHVVLDRNVPSLRPAMRFRGEVEIARLAGVLTVPRDAVFPRPEGPVVWAPGLMGFRAVPVSLGQQGRSQVEILAGLRPGDRVAARDPAAAGRP
jgi:HlyD family secretion protein